MASVYSIRKPIVPLRSRLGCKTCRIRKVKCGQEKPLCVRCTSTGRKCEYDANPVSNTFSSTPSTNSILDRSLSSAPNTVWRERRAFAYYSEHVASFMAGDLDLGFWRQTVPQVCRREPAVWDAVNAISALFESPDPCLDPVFLRRNPGMFRSLDQSHQDALTWYSRSLSTIRGQIDRGAVDTHTALVSCVLFVCIETLQGHVESALELYRQGETLVLNLLNKGIGRGLSIAETTFLKETVIPLFLRLGTIALSISGVPPSRLISTYDIMVGNQFTSLDSARVAITALVSEGMLFQRAAEVHTLAVGGEQHVAEEFIAQQKTLVSRIEDWHCAFQRFLTSASKSRDSAAANLLTYYAATKIVVSVCLASDEAIYDVHISDFQTIVDQAEIVLDASAGLNGAQPPFTFEMGAGLPLFLTAMKCRHRSIRAKALQLLRKSPQIQGFYKCTPGAALAQKLAEMEEVISSTMLNPEHHTDAFSPASTIMANDTTSAFNLLGHPSTTKLDSTYSEIRKTPPLSPNSVFSNPMIIPNQARIKFVGIFRPQDTPWLVGNHDLSKWKRGPDQLFIRFMRYRYDTTSGLWEWVDDVVPIDY
ncbi:Zn(II)2Cys6 transcription factor domain-containing protein [Aspergillus affinis]|uniref:Zn(II)2Cys6 transcription factor domain-containing protein n=1 Tax=Aspergillus affinis TaxID=1070780 RepID=UPI0022FE5550|nr:putative C6 finger domain protein [Aspergillus affinis]KAI9044046.1 putative C6 finger domain protein [Aspergillus affinis]